MALPDPRTISGPVGVHMPVPTPQDGTDGQATHPSVVYIPETFGGFTYWMAMTPYLDGDDEYEDPCILCSNDGIAWGIPAGLTNPIDDQPGSPGAYNSDTDLVFVDGVLYLFWRTFDPAAVGAEEKLYYSSSVDGVVWSAKTLIYSSDMAVRRLLSPAFVFEGGAWVFWAVDVVPSPNQPVRVQGSSTPAGAWGTPVGVDMGALPRAKNPGTSMSCRSTAGTWGCSTTATWTCRDRTACCTSSPRPTA